MTLTVLATFLSPHLAAGHGHGRTAASTSTPLSQHFCFPLLLTLLLLPLGALANHGQRYVPSPSARYPVPGECTAKGKG